MKSWVKRALAALTVGGVTVLVAVQRTYDNPATVEVETTKDLSCAQALRAAEEFTREKYDKIEIKSLVRDRCPDRACQWPDGYICKDNLLYGPGLGGVDSDGNHVLCGTRPGVCSWIPHVVSVGEDPAALGAEFK